MRELKELRALRDHGNITSKTWYQAPTKKLLQGSLPKTQQRVTQLLQDASHAFSQADDAFNLVARHTIPDPQVCSPQKKAAHISI